MGARQGPFPGVVCGTGGVVRGAALGYEFLDFLMQTRQAKALGQGREAGRLLAQNARP